MQIVEKICEMKNIIAGQKKLGKIIGFVPTMGFLHEGHISLVRESVKQNNFTVMSIFVNPTQFGVNEDYAKYPRDLDKDALAAWENGVDVIFAPSVEEMYPEGYKTYVNVEDMTGIMCGVCRPTHFKGVVTVVNKLFNVVRPDNAYFGQKDAQQFIVLKKMVRDLNMNLNVISCPIVREKDGLAKSSRNIFLNEEERAEAVVLSESLFDSKELIEKGEKSKEKVIKGIRDRIRTAKHAEIEYIEIVDAETLDEVETINKNVLIALAVKFGKTRLIDNVIAEV
ncbi:MAG: pantoate--beta-alanine ligase [Clostridia bacterium]|jgi:pantoate--beta-alanine ligase